MITAAELNLLCEKQMRECIELNIERKHEDVALDKSLCHSSLVASQVKYLQRARVKLPSYYVARCVIPARAFEQSSSEAAAQSKMIEGESLLELTCGLGVDTSTLASKFRRVVTCERDEVLANVARENFRRLRLDNIEVVNMSAEEYLAVCEERFDWIYVDPDRRGEDGRKRVVLEDCSPNVLSVWTDIERISKRVAIKCSPMFDVDEAFRLFGEGTSVEVVSVGDECKEVVIYTGGEGERVGATAVGKGTVWMERVGGEVEPKPFNVERYTHLVIPDVALQKGRIARRLLSDVCDIWSDNGYGFATHGDLDRERYLSRVEKIAWIGEYEPKIIRKELIKRGITRAEVMRRDSPFSVERVTKQLKIKESGSDRIAVTKVCNKLIFIILER